MFVVRSVVSPLRLKSPNVKYCDACRKVVNETKTHVHGEEERIKYAYEKRRQESKAKQTGMSIDEIVKEAKKEGLTYGQYVAKYRV